MKFFGKKNLIIYFIKRRCLVQIFYPYDPRFLVDKNNAVSDIPEHF